MPTKPKVQVVAVETKEVETTEKEQSQMFGLLRNVVLATIGAVAIAEEEIEAFVNRLIERGEIAEKDGKKLVREVMDKRKAKSEQLDEQIKKEIEAGLDRINIPTKADIEALNLKINDLSLKIDELKKP
jgi:poly(hydroxyalkanoate) granule-associated protein